MSNSADFVRNSLDKYGFRYQRSLEREVAVCKTFWDGIAGTISGASWVLRFTADQGLEAICSTQSAYGKFVQDKTITLNGNVLKLQVGRRNLRFAIRQSAVIRRSFFPPKITAVVGEMIGGRANDKVKLRAMIPYSLKSDIRFENHFGSNLHCFTSIDELMCVSIEFGTNLCLFSGIRFYDGGTSWLAYLFQPGDKTQTRYLVIESLGGIGYDRFQAVVRKTISAIGFFTGAYAYGPMFIFNVTTGRLVAYNGCVVAARRSRYGLHSLNAYDYYADEDLCPDVGKKIEPTLQPIFRSHFERLMAYLDGQAFAEFYYIFQDVMLSMQFSPAASRLIIYATCLEKARTWVAQLVKGNPVADTGNGGAKSLLPETVRQELVGGIEKIFKRYEDDLDESELKIVQKRIGGWFALPNQDALRNAFDHFGVILSKRDIQLLAMRNKILHGANVIKAKFNPKHPEGRYTDESERICFEYHALVWRLIMASIGYKGPYRNVAEIDWRFRKRRKNGSKPMIKRVRIRNGH